MSKVQIIYAGGDDLFITGAWDEVIELAGRISTDFARYTCQNQDFDISGGLFLARDKFPIRRSALFASEAERQAKKQPNKGAFSLFGQTIDFKDFSEKLIPILQRLKDEIQAKSISPSFFDKLRRIYQHALQNEVVEEMDWRWRYYRLLSRDLAGLPDLRQILIQEEYIPLIMKYTPIIVSYMSYWLGKRK